ncbi:MAG: hypothetical protein KGH94_03940 [Candidatus Micrarchaeota archaeon]|nr:hypothetical protein [Candidatus Micrarchaeota archaeon]
MNESNKDEVIKVLNTKYDNYKITVDFLSALKYYFTKILHDHSSYYIGREMGTADGSVCKPDFVSEKPPAAILNEIKGGIPRNLDFFVKKDMKQLKSFDSVNTGWTNNNITSKEVFLFVLNKYQRRLLDFLNSTTTDYKHFKFKVNNNEDELIVNFDNNFVVWFFSLDESSSNVYFNIMKGAGEPINQEIKETSTENVIIPLDSIRTDLSFFKFYDKEPDDVYLLETFWAHILNIIFNEQGYTTKNIQGSRSLSMRVSLDQVLRLANGFFITNIDSDRGTTAIRRRMVERFFELLCKLDLAKREILANGSSTNNYDVEYKPFSNAKTYFLEQIADLIVKREYTENGVQISLEEFVS